MAIKAIIFDLEGVIMQTKDADMSTTIANALGAPYESVKEFFFSEMNDQSDLGLLTQDQFEGNLINFLGLPMEKIEILRRFHDEQVFVDSALIELIQSLKNNYKIGLLSNYTDGIRDMIEKRWKIGHLFDTIVISSEVGLIKPDPAIYQLILERLGAKPQETVFIDDRIKNIDGAIDFGMHAIHYVDREQSLSKLDKLLKSA